MLAIPPDVAAHIRGLIDDALGDAAPSRWVQRACARENGLVLSGSQLDAWALRPDGSVFCMDLDSISCRTEPVTDPLRVYELLLEGAQHDPTLAAVVPYRKMRLFCCALVRRVWHLLGDPRSRRAVEMAERFADGLASSRELLVEWGEACGAMPDRMAPESVRRTPNNDAAMAAVYTSRPTVLPAVLQTPNRPPVSGPGFREVIDYVNDPRAEKALLACVFGDLTRPAAFAPAWRTETAVGLARHIYDGQVFQVLPILADALEEAGCTDPAVLDHCRVAGEHTRGCWVVDLLLDRS